VLYSFCSQTGCTDGSEPYAGVIVDSAGNLYGTTVQGGADGQGTVFKLAPDGTETVLHSFCAQQYCADGEWPYAGLIADSSGNLYGTTLPGGAADDGAVFKIAKKGKETVLHSFAVADGYRPYAGLIADAQGNLYGTTTEGGAADYGTVFELATNGTETVLYSFCGQSHCADGSGPEAGLIMDSSGNLYGTTYEGGGYGDGTIFKLAPNAMETVLYSFCTSMPCRDSKLPYAALIMDKSGNLYGTTTGIPRDHGTVVKLAPDGTATVLHAFTGTLGSDGAEPYASLTEDAQGNLYGTTEEGGTHDYGTVFKVTP